MDLFEKQRGLFARIARPELTRLLSCPYRATTSNQSLSQRFGNKELQALKRTKFPTEFSQKVDVRKVNVAVLKPWIVETTQRMLNGVEDDILVEFVNEMLEDREVPVSAREVAAGGGMGHSLWQAAVAWSKSCPRCLDWGSAHMTFGSA